MPTPLQNTSVGSEIWLRNRIKNRSPLSAEELHHASSVMQLSADTIEGMYYHQVMLDVIGTSPVLQPYARELLSSVFLQPQTNTPEPWLTLRGRYLLRQLAPEWMIASGDIDLQTNHLTPEMMTDICRVLHDSGVCLDMKATLDRKAHRYNLDIFITLPSAIRAEGTRELEVDVVHIPSQLYDRGADMNIAEIYSGLWLLNGAMNPAAAKVGALWDLALKPRLAREAGYVTSPPEEQVYHLALQLLSKSSLIASTQASGFPIGHDVLATTAEDIQRLIDAFQPEIVPFMESRIPRETREQLLSWLLGEDYYQELLDATGQQVFTSDEPLLKEAVEKAISRIAFHEIESFKQQMQPYKRLWDASLKIMDNIRLQDVLLFEDQLKLKDLKHLEPHTMRMHSAQILVKQQLEIQLSKQGRDISSIGLDDTQLTGWVDAMILGLRTFAPLQIQPEQTAATVPMGLQPVHLMLPLQFHHAEDGTLLSVEIHKPLAHQIGSPDGSLRLITMDEMKAVAEEIRQRSLVSQHR